MRKVIDANYFRDEKLEEYLSASGNNYAVLTDYAAMEAYKGEALTNILNSMPILSKYPDQVIILKGTYEIGVLEGKGKEIVEEFIDADQTNGFQEFCRMLELAQGGNEHFVKQLLANRKAAKNHIENLMIHAAKMNFAVNELASIYTTEELKILRTGKPRTNAMTKKLIDQVLLFTDDVFSDLTGSELIPDHKRLPYLFIFRRALCEFLWVESWASKGGAQGVKASRMRNDMVDMYYVAYATYFEGFLTNDQKAEQIYHEANHFLENIFY